MKISEITADPRISSLWAAVNAKLTVSFKPSDDTHWGSMADGNGTAVVSTAPTAHPVESLAHELLHLNLRNEGYRNLRLILWPRDKSGRYGSHLISALDNELQHHRMFALFQSLGFDPKFFYHDGDTSTATYLAKATRQKGEDFRQPLCDYLTLIAPGGTLTDAQIPSFHQEFRRMARGAFGSKFDEVDRIIGDWKTSPDLNAEPYVRRIIHLLEDPAIMWIGYNKQEAFPADGFFIDQSFEIKN